MTNSSPPDPRFTHRKSPLGFDEAVAILIALASMGTIVFWVLGKNPNARNFAIFQPALTQSDGTDAKAPGLLIPIDPARNTERPITEDTPDKTRIIPVVPNVFSSPQAVAPRNVPSAGILAIVPGKKESGVAIAKEPEIPLQPKAVPVVPLVVAPAAKTRPQQPVKFSDVPSNYWANPYISGLRQRGIIAAFPAGYYRPNQPVTRAEFAAVLERAFGTRITNNTDNFKDISRSFWAAPAIKKASGSGFLQGYPDDTFRPKQEIPRVQAIVALASGLDLKAPANPDQILQKYYKDAAQIPAYARRQVAAATQAGIVVSHPNPQALRPNQNATRADIAALVYEALARQGKVQNVNTKYLVKPQK